MKEEEKKHSTARAGKVTRAKEHWQLFCLKRKNVSRPSKQQKSAKRLPFSTDSKQTTKCVERRKRRQGGKRVETSFL